MLSREPPASTNHNFSTHGERNTPKFRYKDPRNPPSNCIDAGKSEHGRSGAAMLDAGLHHRQSFGKRTNANRRLF
jgi:hypothetical protein